MSGRDAGCFVVLEGPDGAGKTRAAGRLAQHLRASGRAVTLTREPGGTPLGEQIREILLHGAAVPRSAAAEALLFNAARRQLVLDVIRPAIERGDLVVSDRFSGSTLAYQGYGAGVDLAALRSMEAVAVGDTRADLVLLIDAPVEVGLGRRLAGDPTQLTRYEDAAHFDLGFHERVRQGYLALAAAEPQRWRIIDGSLSLEAVDAHIERLVDEFLASGEPPRVLARMQQ